MIEFEGTLQDKEPTAHRGCLFVTYHTLVPECCVFVQEVEARGDQMEADRDGKSVRGHKHHSKHLEWASHLTLLLYCKNR